MKTELRDRLDLLHAERERQLALETEREQRRELLMAQLAEMVHDFAHAPEQIGFWVADLEAHGLVTGADKEAIYRAVVEVAGQEFADEAFAPSLRGPSAAEIAAELTADFYRMVAERESAERASNVIDLDARRAERTAQLLERLAAALGLDVGAVRVRADAEAARRTEARGAHGLMDDGTVYLHPTAYDPDTREGRALLGHEVVHLAQRQEAQVSPGAAAPSKAGAELEAARLGADFAAGHGISRPTQVLPAMNIAADTDAATAQEQAPAEGTEPGAARPTKLDLTLAGRRIELRLPSDAEETNGRITVRELNLTLLTGVTITEAEVTFDEQWALQTGTLKGAVAIGEHIRMDDVQLEVNADAEITTTITGAQLQLGSALSGTIDLTLGSEGVTGTATLTHDQVTLMPGLTLTSGSLTVALAQDGAISASGELVGAVEHLGTVTFSARFADGAFGGTVTVAMAEPVTLFEGVTLSSGTLTGEYSAEDGFTTTGSLTVTVRDWASATIDASYTHRTGTWSARGTLNQIAPLTYEDVTLTEGQLTLAIENGELTEVGASARLTHPLVEGTVSGTYDVQQQLLSARGEATLRQELPLGDSGAVLKEARGEAVLEANVLTQVALTHARAEVPYEGQPTFDVTVTDCVWRVPENLISGTGNVTTTRQLTFGDAAGLHMVVAEGASAEAQLTDNRVSAINSGLAFTVAEPAGEVGTGTVGFNFDGETGQVSGEGSFTLTAEYGYPDRAAGPVFVKEGATITVTIAESALQTATLTNCEFTVINPASAQGEGADVTMGRVEGTLGGTLDFQTGMLDATGTAQVAAEWPITAEWGTVVFKEGGSIEATITQSRLTSLNGTIPYHADIDGEIPVKLQGELNGQYSGETGAFGGSLSGTLREAVTIPVNGGADQLILLEDSSVRGDMAGSQLTTLTTTVHAEYHRAGALFLEGSIEGGTYDVQNRSVSFEGELTLKQAIERQTEDGRWKFVVQPDTTIGCTVSDNALTRIGGNLRFQIHDVDGPLLEGDLTDANLDLTTWDFSGSFNVVTARDFDHPRATQTQDGEPQDPALQLKVLQGSGVHGTLTNNAFSEVGADLNMVVNLHGQEQARGVLNGTWDMTQDRFSGEGTFTLTQDLVFGGEANTAEGGGTRIEAWHLVFAAGSGITVRVTDNNLDTANVNVQGKLLHQYEEVANGSVNGDYRLGDAEGFSGTVQMTCIAPVAWDESGRFATFIDQGTTFTGVMEQSRVTSANGTFILLFKEQETDKIKVTVTCDYTPEAGVNGTGVVEVVDDVLISDVGTGYKLFLAATSGGEAVIAANALQRVGGTIKLRMDKDEETFATGDFTATYEVSEGESARVDATGQVDLLGRLDVTPEGSPEYRFIVLPGTQVGISVLQSDLEWIDGNVNLSVEDASGEFLSANANGRYTHAQRDFTGTGTVTVTREKELVAWNGYSLKVVEGAGAEIDVRQSALHSLGATIPMRIDDAQGGLVAVELQGTYTHADQRFNGQGTASLLRRVPVAENVAPLNWSYYVEPSTGITAVVTDNDLRELRGNLIASVHDAEGQFVEARGEVVYAREGEAANLTITGSAEFTRDKQMATAGEYAFTITQGSNSLFHVTNNQLDRVGGTIDLRVDKGGAPFATAELVGSYTPAEGFTGEGEAELLVAIEVGTFAGYTLWVDPSTSARVGVVGSEIQSFGGTLNARLVDEEGDFLKIEAEASYDYPGQLFSGTGSAEILNDRRLTALGQDYTAFICRGTGAQGEIRANELQWIAGQINLRLDQGAEPLATGTVEGRWEATNNIFSGEGDFSLVRDYVLTASGVDAANGRFESYSLVFCQGASLRVSVAENAFDYAQIDIGAKLLHNADEVANGSVNGRYKVGDAEGFSGNVTFNVIREIAWEESGRFHTFIGEGTNFSGSAAQSRITEVNGTFILIAKEATEPKVRVTLQTSYVAGGGLNASGQIEVVGDILISEAGEGYSIWLATGSGGTARVEESQLVHLGGTLKLRVDKDAQAFATGDFSAEYNVADGQNAIIDAEGTVTLLGAIDMSPEGVGDRNWHFWLTGGTGVSLKITQSALDWVEGTVNVRVDEGTSPAIECTVNGRYTAGPTPDLDVTGEARAVRPIDLGVRYEGYQLWLNEGAGAQISVQDMQLHSLSANIPLLIKTPEALDLIDIQLQGTYTHADQMFSGSGSATLLRQFLVADNVGAQGYSFYLEPGTGLTATVEQNVLTQATGTLNVGIHDAQGEFLRASGDATYSNQEGGQITRASATLQVTREKQMLTTAAGYVAWLEVTSGAHIEVTNNNVDELSGTLNVRVDNAQGPFARVALEGRYTEAEGFNGSGTASLLQEYQVATVGEYTLKALPGTGANITLVSSDITTIGGTVNARIDDATGPFVQIEATATYDFPGANFTGNGSAEVLRDKQLASLGGQNLFLCRGTGATASVLNNSLQTVGGQINLRLEDEQGAYLTVRLGGSFDAAGGTGFTGSGEARITRDKRLAQIGSYEFWLAVGAGATAHIENNALTRVDGSVPFKIMDGEAEPLLTGSANGTYDAETKKFDGNGNIRLGRDIEYTLGSNTVLKLKRGSGGNGEVVQSELRRLGGTLNCELWTDGRPLISLNADGMYNAVTNTLEYVDGSATMMRPFELLGGNVRVERLSGRARVENNRLVSAGGSGAIVIPPLNNMRGTFNLNWRNDGTRDIYSGSGTLDFTLLNDPRTGRRIGGRVSATYNEDNTFRIAGTVDYAINRMISGTLGVEVDQTLDPVLSGSLSVSQVPLVQARDLFSTKFDLLPKQSIVLFPGVNLDLGIAAGMGLGMEALTFSTTIGVSNFRPLRGNIPDFEALLQLNWGLNAQAAVMAYAGLSVGVPGLNAGVGIEGEVRLNAPVRVQPYGVLRGRAGKYSGELGVGVTLAPTLDLYARPYLQATLGREFRHNLTEWHKPLGELFRFEWGKTYKFGDDPASAEPRAAAQRPAFPPATRNAEARTSESSARNIVPEASSAANNVQDGPQLESGQQMSQQAQQGGNRENPLGQLQQHIDRIKIIAEGVGAAFRLIRLLTDIVRVGLTYGPAGVLIYIIWKVICGDISFDGIKRDIQAFLRAAATILELIEPYMPDWWSSIKGFFSGPRPGLLSAFFGADDQMRAAVRRGDHRHAVPEMRGKMIDEMIKGWCGEADQECIITVLEHSARAGDIGRVVTHAGGPNRILRAVDGREDDRARQLFRNNGISW